MHYDDAWEESHKEQFETERTVSQTRKVLLDTLNEEDMIKIMFKDYLHKCSVGKIKELAKEYIRKKEDNG